MKNLIRIWPLALLGLLVFVTPSGAELQGPFDQVGKLPGEHSLSVVVFDEYLNFTCPHCNNFRKASKEMKKKFGSRLKINYVPILFSKQTEYPIRFYYVAQSVGRGEEIKTMIFEAVFDYGVNPYDPSVISYLARSAGLGEKFRKEGGADWVTQRMKEGFARAKKVGVEATPTVVLEGALRMSPKTGMREFVGNLDQVITQLLKKN